MKFKTNTAKLSRFWFKQQIVYFRQQSLLDGSRSLMMLLPWSVTHTAGLREMGSRPNLLTNRLTILLTVITLADVTVVIYLLDQDSLHFILNHCHHKWQLGCPLSPALFPIFMEWLAAAICHNIHMTGI